MRGVVIFWSAGLVSGDDMACWPLYRHSCYSCSWFAIKLICLKKKKKTINSSGNEFRQHNSQVLYRICR